MASLCGGAVAVYLVQFPSGLSESHTNFGEFGSYVGGVVGSVAALATVFLVWRTLVRMDDANRGLQEQLTLERAQSRAAEMRLRIDRIVAEIDDPIGALHVKPVGKDLDGLLREFQLTENASLAELLGDLRFLAHSDELGTEFFTHGSTNMLVRRVAQQFLELAYCMCRYDELVQDTFYTDHFRIRFELIAAALCQLNMLSPSAHEALSEPESRRSLALAWGDDRAERGKPRCSNGLHMAGATMRENWKTNRRY